MSEAQAALTRLAAVRQAMAAACGERAVGHKLPPVTLVAASKRQPLERVITLYDAGVRDFGENYVQELTTKAQALAATGRVARWHLIGPLQRNKAIKVVPHVHSVHTVDRAALVDALQRACEQSARTTPLPVLIQVRLSPDSARAGVNANDENALVALAAHVNAHHSLRLVGLMGLPPADVPASPHFARLAALKGRLMQEPRFSSCTALSIGMTHDFRAAILEGATMVRIGSGLFGPRS